MAANDTSLLTVQGTVGGQNHVHTLHFRLVTGLDNESTLLADWQTYCLSAYKNIFGTADTPVEILRCSRVCGSLPLPAAVEAAPTPNAGLRTVSGERMPSWLAELVSVRTAYSGKSHRGRMYLGGLYETDVTGNDMTGGSGGRRDKTGDYLTALGRWIGSGSGVANFRLVVHSHKIAGTGADCTVSASPVTSFIHRPQAVTMKSRKPGHGS